MSAKAFFNASSFALPRSTTAVTAEETSRPDNDDMVGIPSLVELQTRVWQDTAAAVPVATASPTASHRSFTRQDLCNVLEEVERILDDDDSMFPVTVPPPPPPSSMVSRRQQQ